jgi:hypothetical protein
MNHPEASLAPYVDGSLAPEERAEVDAHLAACIRCRREVALAVAARAALTPLDEVDAPEGLGVAAIAEGQRLAAERYPEVTPLRRPRPLTSRWLTAAGAAAAVLLALAIVPNLGRSTRPAETLAEDAAAPAFDTAPASVVEIQDTDYDQSEVERIAAEFLSGGDTAMGPTATAAEAGGTRFSAQAVRGATACLDAAFEQPDGTLTRIIRARYGGKEAYLGFYLVGPGAGLPPDALRILVAGAEDCSIISSTQARV